MTLLEIFDKYGTDKGSIRHRYDIVYERIFDPLREKSNKILEIGVLQGRSISSFREYFVNSVVYGLDIDSRVNIFMPDDPNIFIGDASNTDVLSSMVEKTGKFDIIIDDANHIAGQAVASFKFLFEYGLNSGGIYVIEDLPIMLSDKWSKENDIKELFFFGKNIGFNGKVDSTLRKDSSYIGDNEESSYDLNYFEKNMKSIVIEQGLFIVYKR
jgi:hypothetical protein